MKDDLDKIAKAFSSTSNSSNGKKSASNKTSQNKSSGKNYWGKNYYKNPALKNNKTSTSKSTSNKSKSVATNAINKGLNDAISNTVSNSGVSSSQSKVINKEIRKLPLKSKICIILIFILGVLISLGSCYFICRNDQFEIIGKKTITLNVNDSYTDAGVKIIAFGKDISSKATIEVRKDGSIVDISPNELDTSEECVYQIFYKLNNFRFRDVKIARTITILVPEEIAPEEDAYEDNTSSTSSITLNV